MGNQLVNDPNDPRLGTAEYEFLYKMYKGFWTRHVDQADPMFDDMWGYINACAPKDTFFHDKVPILEQDYELGEITYRALWTKCDEFAKKIEGPPDVLTWQAPMLPPANLQKLLF